MKKIFIGSFVGAIILFIWSFLAWVLLPLHLHTFSYTPVQDSVLKILENNQVTTGAYLMPMADNRNVTAYDSKFKEESQKVMEESKGKPMATIFYLKDGVAMNAFTIIRGFLINLLSTLVLAIILAPAFSVSASFFGRWWLTLMAALFLTACGPLIQFNWMGVPWGYAFDLIVDHFLNWGITGLWFAFYFKPGK